MSVRHLAGWQRGRTQSNPRRREGRHGPERRGKPLRGGPGESLPGASAGGVPLGGAVGGAHCGADLGGDPCLGRWVWAAGLKPGRLWGSGLGVSSNPPPPSPILAGGIEKEGRCWAPLGSCCLRLQVFGGGLVLQCLGALPGELPLARPGGWGRERGLVEHHRSPTALEQWAT